MSLEIELLNTYSVSGKEGADRLYHVETVRDWQGREVEVPVYDIPVDVRIAMARTRLARQRQSRAMHDVELRIAA
jgi:hypothetical protein